eukprot:CAMPEP_0179107956 /NCGR_PEP_ID=MMETSP0796-20121207/50266_1 /TAXON_ID=73915 /ORGANISM="Pyrodinium bahamense, Strain pbaha01" /LENGTH=383 /DNA_ID=CAMNT_0020806021 /DNA_START=56 /DNA_END=1204 /DNA_ORIENTATION=-
MSKRFTPVLDPERARCEQNEESLRKHRQFDTPFALLPKNLNQPKQPKQDQLPLAKRSEDLYLDENKLWRKKTELFDKKKTWGRETFEYSNPEEARTEGSNVNRKWRPGDVGWGIRGTHGGRGEDSGTMVHQRGEVDQTMVKNEKGLWVQRKRAEHDAEADEAERSPVPDDGWRCPKCQAGNKKSTHLCKECGIDRTMYEQYKARPGEDPRLEAAKPRGRGTPDAQARALQTLEERRRRERAAKEQVGLMRRPTEMGGRTGGAGCGGGQYVPLNSSSQQVRSSKRLRKFDQWQGVQRTDEDAVRVVGRALGGASHDAQQVAKPLRLEDLRERGAAAKRDRSPFAGGAVAHLPSSPSRSRSRSLEAPSATGEGVDGGGGTLEVDF